MLKIAYKLKPYRVICGIAGLVILVVAYVILNLYNDTLTPTERASIIGLFGISAWLFTPFVTYILVLEDRDKYYFLITVYPKFYRVITAYGWFVVLFVFTFVWTFLLLGQI